MAGALLFALLCLLVASCWTTVGHDDVEVDEINWTKRCRARRNGGVRTPNIQTNQAGRNSAREHWSQTEPFGGARTDGSCDLKDAGGGLATLWSLNRRALRSDLRKDVATRLGRWGRRGEPLDLAGLSLPDPAAPGWGSWGFCRGYWVCCAGRAAPGAAAAAWQWSFLSVFRQIAVSWLQVATENVAPSPAAMIA